MNKEHFEKQDFDNLLSKALQKYNREEVFFYNTSNDKIIEICNDIDNLVESESYNLNDNIVIIGFRMNDKRIEPIYHKLSEKYDEDIDDMCLYTLIAFYLNNGRVPTIQDVQKYIVYDAVYGGGRLFYNMSYV